MDTDLWKRTCGIDYFRTISCVCVYSVFEEDRAFGPIAHEIVRKELISQIPSEFRRVMSSRGKNVRVLCDRLFLDPVSAGLPHTQQGPTRRRLLLTHPLLEVPVSVVEGELPLLLIYHDYRLSPIAGWRVIEPPGHPHLQVSFHTTNTKETLTAIILLHVSKSSDAVNE